MADYQAHFLNTGEWWIAWTDDVPGALTQGKTLEEARDNLTEGSSSQAVLSIRGAKLRRASHGSLRRAATRGLGSSFLPTTL